MLDAVKRLGLSDDTVIAVWSDHGQNLGEHNTWCKMTLWDSSTRVPFMIRDPSPASAQSLHAVTNSPAQLLDLYPTLATLAGP